MNANNLVQCLVYLGALLVFVKPLGAYMAGVYQGRTPGLEKPLGPFERFLYRLCGVRPDEEMTWQTYATAMLLFNGAGLLAVYVLQRVQHLLPFNPMGMGPVSPDSAFNTAVSFATNTNWQGYAGETTMSYLTQMLALTVQNFVSAASGLAVMAALIRGFSRRQSQTIGNFWADLVRGTLYILLPLSAALALVLVSQGVVQTLGPSPTVALVQATRDAQGKPLTDQVIAVGPVASQVAIKQLGTNGGGFFNANSAHPLENPTAASNFFEMLSILLIAAALCYTFGRMVGDTRQGWALLAAMTIIFIPMLWLCVAQEQRGNPAFDKLGVDQAFTALQPGGNMEGKEARFGIASSAIWATATTAASNGSVNAMHDSFTPLGGLVPMAMIQLSEVIYGGVGSGLYGMLLYAVVAVFLAGLMVGRTPEYLGKKIEAFEMKMASIGLLMSPACALVGTGHWLFPAARGLLGLAMFFGRFWITIPVLAMAGSLARKKHVPESAGTLPTHTPLFIVFLVGIVLLVGALTFFPALALGPIVEHLLMIGSGR
jgi:K+-transporting ATPase ATPase A chain